MLRACLVAATLASVLSASAGAAELTIQNTNQPGAGFNDSTPAAPVGLNFGTTRGEQALIDFDTAAAIWGAAIRSATPIVIDSAFVGKNDDPSFICNANSVVLGYARLTGYINAASFPDPTAGYVIALANALSGHDLTPGQAHIKARFNADLGTASCPFPSSWYFGLDTTIPQSTSSLLTTLLHEFAHGLGYVSFVDPGTGSLSDVPSIFDVHIFDTAAGVSWASEPNTQRKTLATTPGGIAFDGDAVRADVPTYLGYATELDVTAGADTSPLLNVPAAFSGPLVGSGPVTAASPLDACTDLAPGSLTGQVALIERGDCDFIVKATHAANAGAVAVIIFNNADTGYVLMAGTPNLSIPAVFILQADGQTLQSQLALGPVTAAFVTSTQLSNTDPTQTRVLLYTPSTVRVGSSVSHWNNNTFPRSLLMEFAINPDIRLNMDFTPDVMADLGWSVVKGVTVSVVKALNPGVPAGGQASYVIAVLNRRATAVSGVSLDVTFPGGTTPVSNQGACTTSFPCALGTMEAGDVRLVVATVRAPATVSGPFTVNATLTPPTADAEDNLTASNTQTVAAGGDVQVHLTGPATLTPGTTATFTTTLTNAGPGEALDVSIAGTVVASDGTSLAFGPNTGDCSAFPCLFATLASGATQTFTSSVAVPAGFNAGMTVTVTATAATPDPNPANNTASASVGGAGSPGKSGCSATGEPATVFGLLGLGLLLALRRRQLNS